jgi:hypothetical protein
MYGTTNVKFNVFSFITVQHNAIFETMVYEHPYRGLGSFTNSQLDKLSCGKLFTPVGSESCTNTEGHPLLAHGSAAFETKELSIRIQKCSVVLS